MSVLADAQAYLDRRVPHLADDVEAWRPAPTRARESRALLVSLALVLLASLVAVAIGAPPALLVLLGTPVAVLYAGRWAARMVIGDDRGDPS